MGKKTAGRGSRDEVHRLGWRVVEGFAGRAPMFLVVDDDHLVAGMLVRRLHPHGAVCVARDFEEGRAAIAHHPSMWSAAVVDVQIPGAGNGLDLVELLREADPDLPVMVLSGFHEPAFINRATALGASYAVKPGEDEHFARLVGQAAEHDRRRSRGEKIFGRPATP